jgi:hypothetical protein
VNVFRLKQDTTCYMWATVFFFASMQRLHATYRRSRVYSCHFFDLCQIAETDND